MEKNFQKFLDPQTLAKLQGLSLRTRHVVEGYVSGVHRSPFHGFSVEFSEHREYTPGDDLRYLDWKLFGRTDKYYLKQFEDETNLVCSILFDVSESMSYGSDQSTLTKREYAECVAASLAWLVLQQQDAIGLVTFDHTVQEWVRPEGKPSHLQQIIRTLETPSRREKSAIGPVLQEVAGRLERRGIVVLISDLLDDVPALVAGLKHIHHRRHDVIVFQILDPAEVDFPFEQTTRFQGLEGFPDAITEPLSLKAAYLAEFGRFLQVIKSSCLGLGIDYHLIQTSEKLDTVLTSYLSTRSSPESRLSSGS